MDFPRPPVNLLKYREMTQQSHPTPPAKSTVQWQSRQLTISEASALAAREQHAGNLQGAADIYDLILTAVPHFAEAHNNRGTIFQLMRRYQDALACYDKAIALKPDYALSHFNRGFTLKQMNRLEEALVSYDQAIALNPNHAEVFNNRGTLLQTIKRYDEALASYERAIALKPDFAMAYNNRGVVLMNKGSMREAEKMFRQALQLKPDFADALYNLVKIHPFQKASEPEVALVQAMAEKPGIPPETKEHLYFALGKIYDDCGLYDEAFTYYQRANDIRGATAPYSAVATTRMTNAIIEVFNRDFLAQKFTFSSENKTPLFIVGMPRSGTTLLASILSNHPAIATAGELPDLLDAATRLGGSLKERVPYPHAARHMTADAAARIIRQYEKRLLRDVQGRPAYVIDKHILNFWHLGFVSMLFPRATIIHCTRAPLDTCLSNYFQRFPPAYNFSFDLPNLGHYYREYARLMEHWRTIPQLKLMDASYEDMIRNTEKIARQVIDFLGLDWDERCLSPHTNPAPVETAAEWQVRQPIYDHSIARWRHYEKYLGPLKEILARNGS
jgi:tetratricopeptide (TPR) repeat protein